MLIYFCAKGEYMASARGNWQLVKIDDKSDTPIADLAKDIAAQRSAPNEYNLLYQFKQQKIMIHLDSRIPSSITGYLYDLDRRGVEFLKTGLEQLFPDMQFVDVGAKKRNEKMYDANTESQLTAEQAIDEIKEYQVSQAFKQSIQSDKIPDQARDTTPKVSSGWSTFFGGRKSEAAVQTPAAEKEFKKENVLNTPRKNTKQ